MNFWLFTLLTQPLLLFTTGQDEHRRRADNLHPLRCIDTERWRFPSFVHPISMNTHHKHAGVDAAVACTQARNAGLLSRDPPVARLSRAAREEAVAAEELRVYAHVHRALSALAGMLVPAAAGELCRM